MKKILILVLALTTTLVLAAPSRQGGSLPVPPSRSIAITFDDLPLNGPDIGLASMQQMTEKLTASIQSHHVPTVGFVNEKKLFVEGEIDARTALLAEWLDRGVELGNHTFSHANFQTTPLEDYEDDVIRGENVTQLLLAHHGMKLRYFRFPYLRTGPTLEIKKQFEDFLARHGYINAPVTIENADYIFAALYTRAKLAGDRDAQKHFAQAYLDFTEKQLDFFEKFSVDVLGREPRQIFLVHANWLNADHFDDVIAILEKHGYQFIPLGEALQDDAYRLPDTYAGEMGVSWIERWAFSKGMPMRVREEPDPPNDILKESKAVMQIR